MLCRANMGSENDMFNIHGQVQGLPWDPSRGLIKLHSTGLHTHSVRAPPSYPFPSQIPMIRLTSKPRSQSYSFNLRCWFDSPAASLPMAPTTPQHTGTRAHTHTHNLNSHSIYSCEKLPAISVQLTVSPNLTAEKEPPVLFCSALSSTGMS